MSQKLTKCKISEAYPAYLASSPTAGIHDWVKKKPTKNNQNKQYWEARTKINAYNTTKVREPPSTDTLQRHGHLCLLRTSFSPSPTATPLWTLLLLRAKAKCGRTLAWSHSPAPRSAGTAAALPSYATFLADLTTHELFRWQVCHENGADQEFS